MQRLARKFTGTFRCYYRSSKSYSDGLKDGTTITINHSKKDQEVASDLDMEKQLFRLKRAIGSHYSLGKYDEALNVAIQLEEKSLEIFGKSSPVYASSVNNVGLMQKMLGNTEFAMNKYIHALQIYETSVGKQHSSYLSTLTNLGVLYKACAQATKGIEKQQLIERAEEALGDSIKIRSELVEKIAESNQKLKELREIISSKNHLGLVYQVSKRSSQAESLLRETLIETRAKYGSMDLLTATCLNNLGYVLKSQVKNDESKLMYEEALDIRTSILGTKHPETIVSMHNLAELLIVTGDNEKASKLQHQILEIVGKSSDSKDDIAISGNNSSNSSDQISKKTINNITSVTKTQQSTKNDKDKSNNEDTSLDTNTVKPSTRKKKI